MRKPILSPDRNKGGNQPLMKGPFFIFLVLMPAFLFLVFLILLAMQYKQLKALVAPRPVELPAVDVSPEAQARARAKLDSFLAPPAAPRASHAQDTLALDAGDLNALIRGSAALERLHLDYHLSLQDTLLVARNSLPVERLNGVLATLARVLHVHGYLNSEMRAYPDLEGGKLYLVPVAAVMNGIPAPPSVLSSKGKIEAREWVGDKEAFDRAVSRLAAVRIRGGRLLLIRR
jgi:hypothetical protein